MNHRRDTSSSSQRTLLSLEQQIQATAAGEEAEQGTQATARCATAGRTASAILVIAALVRRIVTPLRRRVVLAVTLLRRIVTPLLLRRRVSPGLLLVIAHVRPRGVAGVVRVPAVRLLLIRGLGRLRAAVVRWRFVVFVRHVAVYLEMRVAGRNRMFSRRLVAAGSGESLWMRCVVRGNRGGRSNAAAIKGRQSGRCTLRDRRGRWERTTVNRNVAVVSYSSRRLKYLGRCRLRLLALAMFPAGEL